KLLLERESDTDKLNSMMNRLELDPSLMRCVIAIDLSFHQTKYFSINLNLGYQSTIEKMRSDLLGKIQANEFLNAEDLVIDHGGLLVIIKSFIPVGDLSRIYLSLDVICRSLVTTLEQESAIDFNIAYGNLYYGVSSIYKSLQEAKDTLHIGKLSQSQAKFNNLESVLFETICLHLQPQFINKLLEPALKLLQKDAQRDYQQLLECAETYVDTSSNIAQTARLLRVHRNTVTTRLQRFHQITNFDSSQSFSNAFLIKLLAVYQRLTDASPQIEEALPYFRQP
ncbi:MAG: helix-turn-helix domain-containing protein, partial [Sphaerochaeta sp.]